MVEECRVHRLADEVVAPESEREVAEAAADPGSRTARLDLAGRLEERLRVVVVLLDTGRDREDVRIEDDVLGRHPRAFSEEPIRPLTDGDAPFDRGGLPLFVESHHDDAGAEATDLPGSA